MLHTTLYNVRPQTRSLTRHRPNYESFIRPARSPPYWTLSWESKRNSCSLSHSSMHQRSAKFDHLYSQITNAHSVSAVLPLFQQNHYLWTKCCFNEYSHDDVTVLTRCSNHNIRSTHIFKGLLTFHILQLKKTQLFHQQLPWIKISRFLCCVVVHLFLGVWYFASNHLRAVWHWTKVLPPHFNICQTDFGLIRVSITHTKRLHGNPIDDHRCHNCQYHPRTLKHNQQPDWLGEEKKKSLFTSQAVKTAKMLKIK